MNVLLETGDVADTASLAPDAHATFDAEPQVKLPYELLLLNGVQRDGVAAALPWLRPAVVEAIAQVRRCAPLARVAIDPSGHPDTLAVQVSNGPGNGWVEGWLLYTGLPKLLRVFRALPDRAFWTHWRLVEGAITRDVAGPSREISYLTCSRPGYRLTTPGPQWFVLEPIQDDPSRPGPCWENLGWDNDRAFKYWRNPAWSAERIELHDLWGIAQESATYTRDTKRVWQARDAALQAAEAAGDTVKVCAVLTEARASVPKGTKYG